MNWRPVVDYELREIEYEQRMQQLKKESEQLKIEDEQRRIAHEQRMGQLKGEIAQLNELNSKLDALLCSSSTSSTPPQSTHDNSEA